MTQVSFVIVVADQPPRLDRMLASLRGQGGEFSREFVFVDDGSTDGSYEALLAKTRLWPRTLIVQQRRRGLSAAAVTGVRAATGEAVRFVMGDAVLAPASSEFLYAALAGGPFDMAIGAEARANEPAVFAFPQVPAEAAALEDALFAALRDGIALGSASMIRRAIFRDPGFFDPAVWSFDFAPVLFAALDRRIGRTPAVLAAVPRRDDAVQRAFDRAATLAGFLRAHPDLPPRARAMAVRRAAALAWRYARGHRSPWVAARFLAAHLCTATGLCGNPIGAVDAALSAWDGAPVRKP